MHRPGGSGNPGPSQEGTHQRAVSESEEGMGIQLEDHCGVRGEPALPVGPLWVRREPHCLTKGGQQGQTGPGLALGLGLPPGE